MNAPIALTPGEPAGIGPDLCVILAQNSRSTPIVAIADADMLLERARKLDLPLAIKAYSASAPQAVTLQPGQLSVLSVPASASVECGILDPRNASYVLATLDAATDGCVNGHFAAMVTAPLHKGVINDAGIAFTGHTEYLAQRTNSEPVMMLAADTATGPLRVALATTHLPLAAVSAALTTQALTRALRILHNDLIKRFGIEHPRLLVSGLNPHAGESGHMGREEIDVIEPVLAQLRTQGMDLTGPLPADTLFTQQHLQHADAVLAMYHDQGLPVLKYAGFGEAINITLGLPIIRTSVDHGTALDKAGTGNIDSGSLKAALKLADQLSTAERQRQIAS